MAISFDDFRRMVPKRTLDFVTTILPYVDTYRRKNRRVDYVGSDSDTRPISEHSSNFFLVLSFIADYPEIEAEFNSLGFDKTRIKRLLKEPTSLDDYSMEELYLANSIIIPNYLDSASYYNLTPLDIISNLYNVYNKHCSNTVFFKLFKKIDSTSLFLNVINDYNKKYHEEDTRDIIDECYDGLDVSVINYFETAIKIRHLLVVEDILPSTFNKNERDLVPLSLFLAAFLYEDPRKDENGLNDKMVIINYFKKYGINIDKIRSKLNDRLNSSDMEKEYKNYKLFKNHYYRYSFEGTNIAKNPQKITVQDILTNVFSRKYTKSLSVEKFLSMMGTHINNFEDFNNKINSYYEDYNRELISGKLNDFYKDLNKDVKDYMQFTAKTYKLILNKMKENKHDKNILKCEDDADTLALLIASYYFNCNVAEFYKSYGIQIDKVLKLIGLNITKEDIINTPLDERILVNKFNRFVVEGNNKDMSKSGITINDIALNLCSRDFNKSSIMEDIFNSLTDKKNIDGYFKDRLKNELNVIEKRRVNDLFDRIFKDIPIETVNFFEDVSSYHASVLANLPYLKDEDVKTISMLLAISTSKTIYGVMFRSLGITEESLKTFFKSLFTKSCSNVDIINNNYCVYLFNGANRNLSRNNITLGSTVRNIINKKLNNSAIINKYLNSVGLSYDDFDNVDELLLKAKNKIEEIEKSENYKKIIEGYHPLLNVSLKYALKTYNYIYDNISKIKECGLITSDKDVIEASMLLGLTYYDNSNITKFFKKYGLNREKIAGIFGLNNDDLEIIDNMDTDYRKVFVFERYLELDKNNPRKNNIEINDMAIRLFKDEYNDSKVIEMICASNNIDYKIFKKEVETGKDYEESLTVKDRIAILDNTEIDTIDMDEISTILQFGNSLIPHSKFIYNTLPKLAESDSHEKSVESIQDLTSRVYDKNAIIGKKNLFSRLFKIDRNAVRKVTINKEALEELKEEIDRNITILSQELLGYDQIRKYMESYRKRNTELYKIAYAKDQELTEELDTLDPSKEEDFDRYLKVRSLHQIMRDKTNRFSTTNKIAQQDLLRINDAITNHFITINALEMAKNDLLPLIGSELALTTGRLSEEQALSVSGSVLDLFRSLLTRNVSAAKDNMEMIRNSGLPSDIVETLTRDVDGYLEDVKIERSTPEILPESIIVDAPRLENKTVIEANLASSTGKKKILVKKQKKDE